MKAGGFSNNGQENGNYWDYRDYMGIMDKKMEPTIYCLGFRVQGPRVHSDLGALISDCGVHGDPIIIYPQPYSMYVRGTIRFLPHGAKQKHRFVVEGRST